jgi:hypothetical protein
VTVIEVWDFDRNGSRVGVDPCVGDGEPEPALLDTVAPTLTEDVRVDVQDDVAKLDNVHSETDGDAVASADLLPPLLVGESDADIGAVLVSTIVRERVGSETDSDSVCVSSRERVDVPLRSPMVMMVWVALAVSVGGRVTLTCSLRVTDEDGEREDVDDDVFNVEVTRAVWEYGDNVTVALNARRSFKRKNAVAVSERVATESVRVTLPLESDVCVFLECVGVRGDGVTLGVADPDRVPDVVLVAEATTDPESVISADVLRVGV